MTVQHRLLSIAVGAGLLALTCGPAHAHEFWISPERGVLDPGEVLTADLKVGQRLKGESYPYLSDRFQVFTRTVGGETWNVAGLDGDLPALSLPAEEPGLTVIAHQTIAFRVTYDDWALFKGYLTDEGLESFAEDHRRRGLPESGFAERYVRTAKALVQVGPVRPEDSDRQIGMRLELFADANPYSAGLDSFPVRLLWRGAPLADRLITIFHNDGISDEVSRRTVITDQEGACLDRALRDRRIPPQCRAPRAGGGSTGGLVEPLGDAQLQTPVTQID